MKTKLFIVSLLFGLLFSFANATTFYDVPEGFWAYDAINKMVDNKVIDGYPDGSFGPNRMVTRAEFAKIIVNTLNIDTSNTSLQKFDDVGPSHWAYKYVNASSDFLTGFKIDGKTNFEPEVASVREDIAVAIVIASKMHYSTYNATSLNRFSDSEKISKNLRKYVAIALENGLINGYDDGTFRPQANLTRAQVCQLMVNLLKVKEKVVIIDQTPTFDDDSSFDMHFDNTDITFNVKDLSLNLGDNWEDYVIGNYRASQRHLIFSTTSLGYNKYKDEEGGISEPYLKVDENGRNYSAYYSMFSPEDSNTSTVNYSNVRTNVGGALTIPTPFSLDVKVDNKKLNYNNRYVKAGSTVTFKASTLNTFARIVYKVESLDTNYEWHTLLEKSTSTNAGTFEIPKFNISDFQQIHFTVYDFYGNSESYFYEVWDKNITTLKGNYYSVLSNGVVTKDNVSKIKLGNTSSNAKTYTISDNCKIPKELLNGKVFQDGKPVFVYAGLNSKNEVEQLLIIEDYMYRGTYGASVYDGAPVIKAYIKEDKLNTVVYASDRFEDEISVTRASKWMCAPSKKGIVGNQQYYDGFSIVDRMYTYNFGESEAYVVLNENDDGRADYFFMSNYISNNSIIE